METAFIDVEIVTIHKGKMVKNTVLLQIPQQAAEIINNAWHTEELPQREAITAHGLVGNQIASCNLIIEDNVTAGMLNMTRVSSHEDEFLFLGNVDNEE